LEVSGNDAGALVEGGSAFKMPGKKKLAGETLWLALMPAQPAQASMNAANMAGSSKLQFNLTCPL